jgi:hypothetical protein
VVKSYHYDMPKVASKNASEVAIQASCKSRVERQFDCIFASIPNGGKRSFYGQRLLKQEGVKKGFPDAVIVGGMNNPGRVAFCEFKAGTSLSLEQGILLADMANAGHDVGVFRSQDTLADWLISKGWK